MFVPRIEGFSQDVLYLIEFVIITVIACFTCQCCRTRRSFARRRTSNRGRTSNGREGSMTCCPICFEENVEHAVTTNCGHSYCDSCFERHSRDHLRTPPRCPLCRASVNLLIDTRDPTDSRPFMDRFNRRFSNSPRSVLDHMRDTPMLIQMMWREIIAHPWRSIHLLRIAALIIPGVGYLLSPFDLIPDFLGLVGMIDDAIVLIIVFVWISHLYRQIVLRRR